VTFAKITLNLFVFSALFTVEYKLANTEAEGRSDRASSPAYLEERDGGVDDCVYFTVYFPYGTAELPIPFNISQPV
jgi:hypothetical protein